MKKKVMYYVTIILTMIMIIVSTYSYAAEITTDSLKSFFKEFVNGTEMEGKIEVTDKEIIITNDTVAEELQYDLTEKPTFSVDMVFKNGMNFEQCAEESSKVTLGLFGFCAVAGIKGADPNDAMLYFYFSVLENLQTNGEEAITEENFIDVADYVQKTYKEDNKIVDELFTLSIGKASLVGEDYIVETKLVVNSDKDFRVLSEKADDAENTISNTIVGDLIITVDPVVTPTVTVTPTTDETKDDKVSAEETTKNEEKNVIDSIQTPSTANISKMPNAGFELSILTILKIVLGLSLASTIIYTIYNKRYSSK